MTMDDPSRSAARIIPSPVSPTSHLDATVEIGSANSARFDDEKRRYLSGGDLAKNGPPAPVSGFGEKAFVIRAHGSSQLDVYTKGRIVALNTSGSLDQLKALTKRVLSRL